MQLIRHTLIQTETHAHVYTKYKCTAKYLEIIKHTRKHSRKLENENTNYR